VGKVVHFEVPANDLARAKAFYGDVFGWNLNTMDMGGMSYTSIQTTPVDEQSRVPLEAGAINGGMTMRTAETPAPIITIEVEGIDDALKQVEAAGGATVTPRTPIPDMGAFAYFTDTEGNVMGLWESV